MVSKDIRTKMEVSTRTAILHKVFFHANGSVAFYVSTTGMTRTNVAVELP